MSSSSMLFPIVEGVAVNDEQEKMNSQHFPRIMRGVTPETTQSLLDALPVL
jgi:hypothetical protein